MLKVISLLMLPLAIFAQDNPEANDIVTKGNKLYEEGNFGEAEVNYREAQTQGADPFISGFNLGDALFKQERYEEAAAAFQSLPNLTDDKAKKAAAYHNLGNAFLKAQKFQESVDAYKQSLRNNPKDLETKYNLAYAKQMLQQQQEQQQQNQDNKDDQKNEDQKQDQQQQNQDQKQDENKDQEQKQDQQQQQDQKQDQQKQNKSEQEKEQQQQQQQPQENKISKEDAERMLDAINQEEKDIRDRLEKQKVKKGVRGTIEKDW